MENIEEKINEKYPDYKIANELRGKLRQAAHFGYELGEQMAMEFAEWILANGYMRMGPKYWSNGKHSWVDSKQLFQIFKTERNDTLHTP